MAEANRNAIVLTGCGWVTPFAVGSIDEVLTAGAQAQPPSADELGYWPVPEAFRNEHGGLSNELKRDKTAWMTAIALEHARRAASLEPGEIPAEGVGLVVGDALAGQSGMIDFAEEVRAQGARFVSPLHFPQTVGNYLAGALARSYGIRGASSTLAGGAASGLDAIIEGCSLMASGVVDLLYAGGVNRLSTALAAGLGRPETVLSEGACLFVLERLDHAAARGVTPLAVVIRSEHCDDHPPAEAASAAGLVSTAARPHPDGVLIEHWIGGCFGAAGAAAGAAAVGAARGHPVPIVETTAPLTVRVGRLPDDVGRNAEGHISALVFADADGAGTTMLELLVYPNT